MTTSASGTVRHGRSPPRRRWLPWRICSTTHASGRRWERLTTWHCSPSTPDRTAFAAMTAQSSRGSMKTSTLTPADGLPARSCRHGAAQARTGAATTTTRVSATSSSRDWPASDRGPIRLSKSILSFLTGHGITSAWMECRTMVLAHDRL